MLRGSEAPPVVLEEEEEEEEEARRERAPSPVPVLERRPSDMSPEAEAREKARRQSLDRSNCYLTAATPAEAEAEAEAEVEAEAGAEAGAPPFAEPRAFSDTTHAA